jgi:hypothetical protein
VSHEAPSRFEVFLMRLHRSAGHGPAPGTRRSTLLAGIFLALLTLGLVACGPGGSGGQDNPASTPAPAQPGY